MYFSKVIKSGGARVHYYTQMRLCGSLYERLHKILYERLYTPIPSVLLSNDVEAHSDCSSAPAHIHVYYHTYVYICLYMYRERDGDKERDIHIHLYIYIYNYVGAPLA